MPEARRQLLNRAHRLLQCSGCRCLFILCRACARRRRYCSDTCAADARCRSLREAGRRYQRTLVGAYRNALRQRDWRARRRGRVTHQSRHRAAPVHRCGGAGASGHPTQHPEVAGPASPGPRLTQGHTQAFRHRSAVRCHSCHRFCNAFAVVGPVGPRRTRHHRSRASSPD